MSINFVNDRKSLGYECLIDTQCGNRLVLITDSSVVFVKNVILNGKRKSKRIIFVIIAGMIIIFSDVKSAEAIGLNMPPAPMVRFQQTSYQDRFQLRTLKIIAGPNNRITYNTYKLNGERLVLIYLTDPVLSSNPRILRIVNQVRGGSGDWGLFSVLLALGIAIVILSASAATGAFIAPPPAGWGLDDRNPFQPPGGTHNYPPAYDLLQPRRTCFADRPGFMMSQPPKSTRAELTQLAVVPKTQAGGFLQPDGNIDLYDAYAEVMRRETAIGCEDFDCSFERFKDLATEDGEITTTSTREAISILEGEMRGLYENSRRLYYGPGIKGPDFGVDGIGEYENITHAETKGPVGSAINKAQGGKGDLWEQGKEIAKKTRWQKRYWSNKTKTDQLPLIRPDAYLPKSVDNILGLHDLYDVPTEEKSIMNDAIINYSRNDTNTIILNNETNI